MPAGGGHAEFVPAARQAVLAARADGQLVHPTGGIWQSVYLEATGHHSFDVIHVTPTSTAARRASALIVGEVKTPLMIEYGVLDGRITHRGQWQTTTPRANLTWTCARRVWTHALLAAGGPGTVSAHPHLKAGGTALDCVTTYFGMRSVEVKNGQVLLNHQPSTSAWCWTRLLARHLLTPPDEEAIIADVKWIKELGFNGCANFGLRTRAFTTGVTAWASCLGCRPATPTTTDASKQCQRMMDSSTGLQLPQHYCLGAAERILGCAEICTDPKQQAAARMLTQLLRGGRHPHHQRQ